MAKICLVNGNCWMKIHPFDLISYFIRIVLMLNLLAVMAVAVVDDSVADLFMAVDFHHVMVVVVDQIIMKSKFRQS